MSKDRSSVHARKADRAIANLLLLLTLLLTLAVEPATAAQSELPVVKVLATGGTIANTPDGRVAVETIIEAIPDVLDIAHLRVEDVTRVGSSSLTFQEFIDTAKAIERTLAQEPDVDAFVVTVGSNASEDLAWFLNLVVRTDKPVVVTAAQRQRTTLSEDASRNFLDAVRVAASPPSGTGVVLVANELIHSAREVTKSVVSRVDSWLSPDLGALGVISGDEVVFYRKPVRRHTTGSEFSLSAVETADDLPQVEILYSHVDASPALVHAAIADGAQGLVIAGYLTGTPHAGQSSALQAATADHGTAVVLSTRGSSGRVPPGSGGFVGADTLTPQKAQILLKMALTVTEEPSEIRRIFSQY